ncbi:MAG TPA: lactonase family protein [Terriglobales bacterium]|nr:lactonase family protein [Terriglobales bacterium]
MVAQTRSSHGDSAKSASNVDRVMPGSEKGGDYILYVGTYTVRGSRGIYAFEFDSSSGKLRPMGLMAEGVNPSYLVLDSRTSTLYAVSEVSDYKGQNTGAIQSYKIDSGTGKLQLLNQISSQGSGPCFLSLDESRYLFVANFGGGNIGVFPLMDGGRIGSATALVQHHGSGANPTRQSKPRPHAIALSPNRKLAVVADLGLDKLLLYRFDPQNGSITPLHPPSVKVHDSAGPRHFVFSNDGRHLYLVNEIDSTVSVFSVNQDDVTFKPVQTISTLPPKFTGQNDAAEIRLMPDGRFLYVSNRGGDSLTAYAVNAEQGTLKQIGTYSSEGKTPRTFDVAPGGKFLVVANEASDEISILRVDTNTGALADTGIREKVASPTSFVFFSRKH